jgi:hypothetical protein
MQGRARPGAVCGWGQAGVSCTAAGAWERRASVALANGRHLPTGIGLAEAARMLHRAGFCWRTCIALICGQQVCVDLCSWRGCETKEVSQKYSLEVGHKKEGGQEVVQNFVGSSSGSLLEPLQLASPTLRAYVCSIWRHIKASCCLCRARRRSTREGKRSSASTRCCCTQVSGSVVILRSET